jgi:hypothetical protein
MLAFIVLGYLSTNDKLPARYLKPAKKLYRVLSICVFVALGGLMAMATIMTIITESGWIPRNREVNVYLGKQPWMTGEIKTCDSIRPNDRELREQELRLLACADDDRRLDEHHTLQVKFWGPITADRNKEWKCTREPSSLTCRLQ